MEYRILGHLEVVDGDAGVALGGRKQRELLVCLILNAGRVTADDVLIDMLWGDSPPARAANNLQVLVSRLRRALGANAIARRGSGYVLEAAPDEIDAHRFARLATEGRDLLAAGDAARASEALVRALALWRGDALADFRYGEFAQPEAARLEELRVAAIEDRADADLAVGRHRELVPELERLVLEHPYRERFRRQLALALYRSGRQADALDAYRAARDTLAGELGLEPSPELRELQQAILRHDPTLDAPVPRARAPSRRRRLALVAAAVLVVTAFAVAFGFARGHASAVTPQANSLAVVDPRSHELAATVRLPFTPRVVAGAGRSVWVGAADTNAVVRLDVRTRREVQVVGVTGAAPAGLVADADGAWVSSPVGRRIVLLERFGPGSSRPRASLQLVHETIFNSERFTPLVEGGGRLWASDGDISVTAFNLRSGKQVARVVPDDGAGPLGWGGGDAWVAYTVSDSLTRIDGRRAAVKHVIPLAQSTENAGRIGDGRRGLYDPSAVAYGFGSIWVAAYGIDAVVRIDPSANAVVATIPVGDGPNALVGADGALWVANRLGRSVTEIDPARNAVVATIDMRYRAESIASAGGRLWVVLQGA